MLHRSCQPGSRQGATNAHDRSDWIPALPIVHATLSVSPRLYRAGGPACSFQAPRGPPASGCGGMLVGLPVSQRAAAPATRWGGRCKPAACLPTLSTGVTSAELPACTPAAFWRGGQAGASKPLEEGHTSLRQCQFRWLPPTSAPPSPTCLARHPHKLSCITLESRRLACACIQIPQPCNRWEGNWGKHTSSLCAPLLRTLSPEA